MATRHTLVLLLALTVPSLAACGGEDSTTPPDPGPSDVVKVQGDGQIGEVGKALPTNPTVEVRDASGSPLANEQVEFRVTAGGGSVSAASTTTNVDGRASVTWTLGTVSDETQRLEVSAGSASTTFTAQTSPGPATQIVTVRGDDQEVDPGATLPVPLVVQVLDRYENGVPDVTVEFTAESGSVSPAEIATDSDGLARTTATAGTLNEIGGDASIVPSTLPRPRLTLAYEEALEAARITTFTATAPAVGSASFEARVRSGSGTTWSLESGDLPPGLSLSSDGLITGIPTSAETATFTVRAAESEGGEVTQDYTVVVCEAPLQLAEGESHSAAPPASGECGLFLPSGETGDRYRVAVAWPTTSTSSSDASVSLHVRAEEAAATTAPRVSSPSQAGAPTLRVPYQRFRWDLEVMEATERVHRRLLNEARVMAARLGPDAVLADRSGAALAPSSAQTPDKRDFNAPESSCVDPGTIRAELVAESDEMLVYQDSAQRAENPVDSTLVRQMADFYRDYGKEVIDSYFGGISDIDGNGRFIVLVTPFEDTPGQDALAFVLSRDFHTQEECVGSNEAEITYFSAGGIQALSTSATPNSFQALSALVHEVKHISSLHKRLEAGDLGGRPSWIEEGTADIAAELGSRVAWSETGGPALTSRVRGESFGSNESEPVTPENWGILVRLARIINTFSVQPNALTNDPVAAAAAHTYYGSSWHFHRFLADAYRGGILADSAFFRKQNDPSAEPGTSFLENELGVPFPELVEQHVAATLLNGHSAQASVERTITGYSFPTAAEIFCAPNPLGAYPWPVTTTGSQRQGDCTNGSDPAEEDQNPSAPFADATFEGPLGRGGMRVHDFVSEGAGQGVEINVDVGSPATGEARVVVVRLE